MAAARKTGLAGVALLLVGGIAVAGSLALQPDAGLPDDLRDFALAEPAQLQTVTLADGKGAVAFPGDADNRWTLLAMGFTHCPDICPFMLTNLAEVESQMKGHLSAAELPRFVFLSVDPSRDTTTYLAEYVSHFSDDFLGITGPPPAIDQLTKELGAFYRLGPKDSDGDYTVDHSAEIFLIDPKGRLFGKFQPPLDPQETTVRFKNARRFYAQSNT